MPKRTVQLSNRDVTLSKLDKPFFPTEHLSKGDVIDYYRAIADAMLPHLAGRPLVLRRYPQGIATNGFVQQEASDHVPKWLTIARTPRRSRPGIVNHMLCDDAATLVYLANQAAIEFHVWLSSVDDLDHPDRLVIDLDPPPETSVATLRSVAHGLREQFAAVGLTPFVQATGGRGFHVVAPLDGSANFSYVHSLAAALADLFAAREPSLLTTARRRQRPGDRILLGTGRNAYGRTMVAPYSLRARPGAPIATPLDWSELGRAKPDGHRPRVVKRRLVRQDDPWAAIGDHAAAPTEIRRELERQH